MLQSSSFAALFPNFSRASVATDFDGAGVLQSFAAGVPRLLPGSGVLIEQAVTQLVNNSQSGAGGSGINSNAVSTDLPPLFTGANIRKNLRIVASSAGDDNSGIAGALQANLTASTLYFGSMYVWLPSGVSIGVSAKISLEGGGIGANTYAAALDLNKRDQWQRVIVSASTGGTVTGTVSLVVRTGQTDGAYFYTTCPQIERNEFASSYVPSTGSTAARAVDVLTFDGSRFAAAFTMAQRTNLLLRSQEIDNNSVWSRPSGVIPDTVSPDTQAAPDGTTTADTYNSPTAGVTGTLYQIFPVTPGVVYTFSWYVKLGTLAAADYRYAIRDDTAGAFIVQDVAVSGVTSAGWTRATATFTAPAGCYLARVYLYRYTPATAGTVHLWGAQVEVGSVASTYIATTTAAVTRTGSEVGWAVISVTIPQTLGPSISQGIIELSDGTTSRFLVRSSPGGATINAFYVRSNVGSGAFGLGSMTPGAAFRVAMAWAADGTTRFVGPSGAVVTIAAGGNQPIGGFVTIKLGLEGTGTALNGRLHRFYCGHVAPTDAQLIAAQATSADVRSIMRS